MTGVIKDRVDYKLDFRKSDQTDMYFQNRYQATLKHKDLAQEKTQTFYITKNSWITAKEAYNLLSGRAVSKDLYNREDQPYNAWLQLDFQEEDKMKTIRSSSTMEAMAMNLKWPCSNIPSRNN